MLVFLDGHQFAGAFALLEQPDALFGRAGAGLHIARGVRRGALNLVVPAASVGARALIGVAAIEVTREQAAARVGDAQRAMHENFEFDVRAFLADFSDFVERKFARENDALHAELLPEAYRSEIDRVGLYREVDSLLRPGFAHHVDEAGVGHDQRVRSEGDDRCHVREVGAYLGVVRQDVAYHIEGFAGGVGFGNGFAERFQAAEFVIAYAQAVARLAGIHGIGAESERSAHHGARACRREQFRAGS